ncbi:MAG: ComF family protein, partial [Candidatus Pacebacteria bacterium]|nr:ComF family protein [Candidatus Paceibacterota bacterium]
HQEKFNGFTKPLVIPIPLHKKRKRQRGYNQTELLCNELSLIDNSLYRTENHVLYKHQSTRSQTEILNRKERLKNIQGCFSIKDPEKIHGRNIILIDDITTTGATFREATRVLKKAGVRRVICFAVAH